MKKTIKRTLSIIIAAFLAFATPIFVGEASYAATGSSITEFKLGADAESRCNGSFIGFTAWDCGLDTIQDPWGKDNIKSSIMKIILNIATDLTVAAAYLVIGYVIYGGYMYMISQGDVNRIAMGKKALTNAFIGLAIVLFANIIFNAIRIGLVSGTKNITAEIGGQTVSVVSVDANQMITNAIAWVVGVAGVVSLVFVIYGGYAYLNASGDAIKAIKARNILFYASMGLIIVAIAEIITGFVSAKLRESRQNLEQTSNLDFSSLVVSVNDSQENA